MTAARVGERLEGVEQERHALGAVGDDGGVEEGLAQRVRGAEEVVRVGMLLQLLPQQPRVALADGTPRATHRVREGRPIGGRNGTGRMARAGGGSSGLFCHTGGDVCAG